jgi:hypothetical protein
MNAEGGCSASARSKDYRRIAQCDEARGDPLTMSRKTKRPDTMSRAPFTASHPVKPVDGDGELLIPKSRDAAAGSHRRRNPMNTIPTAIRLESKYPIRIIVNSFRETAITQNISQIITQNNSQTHSAIRAEVQNCWNAQSTQ